MKHNSQVTPQRKVGSPATPSTFDRGWSVPAIWPSMCAFIGIAGLLWVLETPFYIDILITTLYWAFLGMAWNVAAGMAGQFSVGHAAFFGIGAYTSTLLFLRFQISPWLGMFLAGALAAFIAALLGAICLRLRGNFLALATIAFAQIIYTISMQWPLTKGSMGLSIPFRPSIANMIFKDPKLYGVVILCLIVVTYYFLQWLRDTKIGLYCLAMKENEDAARSLGVNTAALRVGALALSAFITAVGGVFYAQYNLFIAPPSVFALSISIQIALIAIIGGVGTAAAGPLLGAFLIVPLGLLLRSSFSSFAGFDLTVFGLVMIVAVIYFPKGLLVYFQKAAERLRRQIKPLTSPVRVEYEIVVKSEGSGGTNPSV